MKRVSVLSHLLPGLSWTGAENGQNVRKNAINSEFTYIQFVAIVLSLFFLSLTLRLLFLGNTFQSSDNAELAFKILKNDGSGYWWILREYYGALINLYVKFFVAVVSSLGVTITEFWWKAPIAILGSLQVPLTYLFLKRRVRCSNTGALWGAAFISVLPIHVFQSRFLWGHEVLGTFFVTLAVWKLVDFCEKPNLKTGLLASIFSGLYLISHGYIIPFVACLISIMLLFPRNEKYGLLKRLITAVKLTLRHFVWVFPLLLSPLCIYPIGHALRKRSQLGLYIQDHMPGFIENTGYLLAGVLFTAVVISFLSNRIRSEYTVLFTVCGTAYLAPLFLGTPPGVTVVRLYMVIGTYFFVLCTAIVVDKLVSVKPFSRRVVSVASVCFFLTLWGTVETIFGRDELFDPNGVKIKQGGIPPDPGSKAAGFLIRKYLKTSEKVLAIHGAVEPPNLFYYFARSEYSFFDLSREQALEKFYKLKDHVDVVVCDESHASAVERDGKFQRRAVIMSEGNPAMLIYAKAHVEMPIVNTDVRELNRLFDKEYAWKVSLR